MANSVMIVQGVEVKVTARDGEDYISLTDMCKAFGDSDQLIKTGFKIKIPLNFFKFGKS